MISNLSTATSISAVTQERGCAGTTEEDTLDGVPVPWHCESGVSLSVLRMHVALASQVVYVAKFAKRD